MQIKKQYNETNDKRSMVLRYGIPAGIIAGLIFIVVEIIVAGFSGGNFIGPLKMIAGIPLQQPPETITNRDALVTGFSFHMFYSLVFGLIAASLVVTISAFRSSPIRLIYLGTLFGILIWFINFYILAPAVNAIWFSKANPLTQFLLHALGFGMILGIYFASVHFKIPFTTSLHKKRAI